MNGKKARQIRREVLAACVKAEIPLQTAYKSVLARVVQGNYVDKDDNVQTYTEERRTVILAPCLRAVYQRAKRGTSITRYSNA